MNDIKNYCCSLLCLSEVLANGSPITPKQRLTVQPEETAEVQEARQRRPHRESCWDLQEDEAVWRLYKTCHHVCSVEHYAHRIW